MCHKINFIMLFLVLASFSEVCMLYIQVIFFTAFFTILSKAVMNDLVNNFSTTSPFPKDRFLEMRLLNQGSNLIICMCVIFLNCQFET